MTDREKLVELCKTACRRGRDCSKSCYECVADHLIENGVTVQNWIPVTERLPEGKFKSKDEKEGWSCETSGAVLVVTNAGDIFTSQCDVYMDGEIFWDDTHGYGIHGEVTHWMPLPEPPKEEA